ncbi:DsbA family oxidoreductase [Niabella drilacis]|uniref:Protein disulfide-isomerase n=1 Tax=Niabella drilacis (strain DSM 25811 / CCM 8410 / CCUG 62505 / LMG 26954 / E90) TaxID=1285928 RepID=A0A1G7ATN1_NIADE|nr:DsbA family oxidoreductase [Niabella drilacis]SDE18228.1 protein disulfide-isomerase [Niabella drilacis]
MSTNKMQVEIWSDVMCPFCYIGKRHFETALGKFTDNQQVEITWKSFQLDPTLPEKEELDHEQYLTERKGLPKEQVKSLLGHVSQSAKQAGLDYHFEKVVTVNSFNAHRLIQMAKTKGLGDAAEERLFSAYFTEGHDIADRETLTKLGKEIGLTEEDVNEALTSEVYAGKVNRDIYEAQQIGVRGVPFFVFDRKYAVSGAQPPEAFTETLDRAFAEWRKANPAPALEITEGPSCTPDGSCS